MRSPVQATTSPQAPTPASSLHPSRVSSAVERAKSSPGRPLDPETRAFAEPRFGHDFSRIRVHTDASAALSAQALHSRAFTFHQHHIAFAQDQYAPHRHDGRRLLAHELAHTLQQQSISLVQREQGGPAPSAARPGTPEDVMFFIMNPAVEANAALQAALQLLDRYSSHVVPADVSIRLMPEAERSSSLARDLRFGGDSTWQGDVPVIRLPQEAMDVIAAHADGRSPPLEDVHEVIRTVGHEMHHLWRAREGHRANPIQPVYEAEAARRLEQVRQNWVRAIQQGTEVIAGVPRTIGAWTDIPQAEQERIETGVSRTDYIQGLYERSAYIVEEIYTKMEELSFLRVQQRHETGRARTPSRMAVSALSAMIHRLRNMMESMAQTGGFVTPELWQEAQQAMLSYLRERYPNPDNPAIDSFEVIFYLNSMARGMPPVFDDAGRLASVPPPGARLP